MELSIAGDGRGHDGLQEGLPTRSHSASEHSKVNKRGSLEHTGSLRPLLCYCAHTTCRAALGGKHQGTGHGHPQTHLEVITAS